MIMYTFATEFRTHNRGTRDMPKVFCSHTVMMDVDKLVEHPDNPNVHPPEQVRLLTKIINGNGWRYPIVVSRRSGYVIKGHARLAAAKLAGWSEVPVDEQEYANEAEEYADMVADNKIAEMSHLDIGLINPMLAFFKDNDYDVELSGYSSIEARSILDGWVPDKAKLDNVEGTDEEAPARIAVSCGKDDQKKLKTAIKELIMQLGLENCDVK